MAADGNLTTYQRGRLTMASLRDVTATEAGDVVINMAADGDLTSHQRGRLIMAAASLRQITARGGL